MAPIKIAENEFLLTDFKTYYFDVDIHDNIRFWRKKTGSRRQKTIKKPAIIYLEKSFWKAYPGNRPPWPVYFVTFRFPSQEEVDKIVYEHTFFSKLENLLE